MASVYDQRLDDVFRGDDVSQTFQRVAADPTDYTTATEIAVSLYAAPGRSTPVLTKTFTGGAVTRTASDFTVQWAAADTLALPAGDYTGRAVMTIGGKLRTACTFRVLMR